MQRGLSNEDGGGEIVLRIEGLHDYLMLVVKSLPIVDVRFASNVMSQRVVVEIYM